MPDLVAIHGLITGLQGAVNITKGFLDLKSMSEVQGKVIELQAVIMSAQSSALAAQADHAAMLQRVADLEKQIAAMKAWEGQKQRYKMMHAWPNSAVIVYSLKESCANGEPAHWICTKCYDDGRRSILNPQKEGNGFVHLVCASCSTKIRTEWRGLAAPEYASD